MKRIVAALLCATVLGFSGCGGGDDDSYTFVGTWDTDERITSENCRWTTGHFIIRVTGQDQTRLAATITDTDNGSTWTPVASCDPKKETIRLEWGNRSGGRSIMDGRALDEDTLEGTGYYTSSNGCWLNTIWTATKVGP